MVSHDDSEAVTEFIDPLFLRAQGRVGQVLRGKWRLDVLLGVGGMAAVYAATHRNGTRAAVKLLHTELSVNPQIRSRFLREGYVANAVGHEGAVKVLDDDTADDGSLFLVTELLDGETLEERRLRFGGTLSEDDTLSIADQLLEVLTAAHAKGIVHRDLKPENVFLTRDGRVKVLDFGIARLRELSTKSNATRAGASMGTPAYMPPEQARGLWDEVDARSDIWAVGATMFHLLTGRAVHGGRTANEQLLEAMTKAAPPIASASPNVTPAVSHVVDKALAFEREKRWQDSSRMQEAARRAYHDRYGAPLSTAPRLTVPETVPNRTLASAQGALAPRLPTTGQPVANSQGAATSGGGGGPLPRGVVAALAFASLAAVGLLVGAIALTTSLWRTRAHTALPSSATPSSIPVPTPSVTVSATAMAIGVSPASSASETPEVAATDLPTAASATTNAPAPTTSAGLAPNPYNQAPVRPPASAGPRSNCNPNYTIDPVTRAKHFKPECF